ncbi:hypothetical protein CYY_005115 [Polysphondylium violaceum]|uniref:Uncharacterized protein n=1 Tax=Polysphondylium violaceum TaxID=133409 RepID=A0A8J4PU98_9MYCE|nr:hypothetical protein CYY_005115 [Polysphondylium violaceum]
MTVYDGEAIGYVDYWKHEFENQRKKFIELSGVVYSASSSNSISTSGGITLDPNLSHNQERYADNLFDTWYQYAIRYAQQTTLDENNQLIINNNDQDRYDLECETIISIKVLVDFYIIKFLLNETSIQDSVIRRFMEQYRKILTILQTKSKFTILLCCEFERSTNTLKDMIKRSIEFFLFLLQRNTSSMTKKIECINSIQTSIDLGNCMIKIGSVNLDVDKFYFDINIVPIVQFTSSREISDIYRLLGFKILETIPSNIPLEENNIKLRGLTYLASLACDELSFGFLWSLGGLTQYPHCSQIIINRLPSATFDVAKSLILSIPDALKSSDHDLLVNQAKGLKVVFNIIDAYQNKLKTIDFDQDTIHYELIDVYNILLQQLPNEAQIHDKMFKDIGCTEETMAVLLNCSFRFDIITWQQCLLPYLREEILKMRLQGVSGIQKEQAVIDCVRECARIFYLDSVNSISFENSLALGKALLQTIVEAMRHGYIETERFSLICSIILTNHLPQSIEWIPEILTTPVCHNHKTSRAVFDIFHYLFGYKEVEESTTLQSLKAENISIIFKKIVTIPTSPAYSLVNSLLTFKLAKSFLTENHYLISMLLDTLASMIEYNFVFDKDQAESITSLVKNLSFVIHPSQAVKLFSLGVKILGLIDCHPSSFGDETLSKIVNQIPQSTPVSIQDVHMGIERGGQETQCALCSFVPQICILEKNPVVITESLKCFATRDDLIKEHYKTIVKVCKDTVVDSIYDLELSLSAAPLMPIICQIDVNMIPECILILYKAIKLSCLNDPTNQPNSIPIKHLETVISTIHNCDQLLPILRSSPLLLSVLSKLKKYNSTFKQQIKELDKRGKLRRNKQKEYELV